MREKRILVLAWSLIFAGGFLIVTALYGTNIKEFFEVSSAEEAVPWNLTLVNPWNKIPEDFEVNLLELSNGEQVDERIYPDLQKMFDEARQMGIYPIVRDGYRSKEEQEKLMDEKIEAYKYEGYPGVVAKKLAKSWVAEVGYSEHQLGLAIDINADKTLCTNNEVYEWLDCHAYKYGFILRYPEDKEVLTGTSYEPWHYRYVGIEAAKEIYEKNLCLEEYVE